MFRVGPNGGAATERFRVPTMANTVGVGRQNQALAPGTTPANQSIVANGLAFDRKGVLYIADTARGALWRVEIDRRGNLIARLGCDTTYPANTLCLDALFVQHPALDGADGIALDRKGNVCVDANERNEIAVVDRDGPSPRSSATRPGAGSLRNARPARVPDEPGHRGPDALHDELGRRPPRQRPEHRRRGGPRTAVLGKVSCLDQQVDSDGLPLPIH